jgi:hypothetical protein
MADEIMTWLPYQDFLTTFQTLSDYHVGRQMHEAGIALDYLVGIGHEKLCDRFRTTRMWKGYPSALAFYHSMAIREHVMRGGRPSPHGSLRFLSRVPDRDAPLRPPEAGPRSRRSSTRHGSATSGSMHHIGVPCSGSIRNTISIEPTG